MATGPGIHGSEVDPRLLDGTAIIILRAGREYLERFLPKDGQRKTVEDQITDLTARIMRLEAAHERLIQKSKSGHSVP
jgi:hypothetical protein